MIAHAPILSIVSRSRAQRFFCAMRALRHDRGRGEPDRHAHRGDHARRALAQLDDRQHREAAAAAAARLAVVVAVGLLAGASSAAIRLSKLSAAIWSMPNVL